LHGEGIRFYCRLVRQNRFLTFVERISSVVVRILTFAEHILTFAERIRRFRRKTTIPESRIA
jgi:hypothetical protein